MGLAVHLTSAIMVTIRAFAVMDLAIIGGIPTAGPSALTAALVNENTLERTRRGAVRFAGSGPKRASGAERDGTGRPLGTWHHVIRVGQFGLAIYLTLDFSRDCGPRIDPSRRLTLPSPPPERLR